MQVDPVTTMVGFSVDCERKTLTYTKTVSVSPAAFVANWRSNMQAQWNATACKKDKLFIEYGWVSVSRNHFKDGTVFVMKSECHQPL